MLRLLVLLAVVLVASGLSTDVTCRCNCAKCDRRNPTYPSLCECKIPGSDDYFSSFKENPRTWNYDWEFKAVGYTLTPPCPSPNKACDETLKTNDGKWTCTYIYPQCWRDPPRVDRTVYDTTPGLGGVAVGYGCANEEKPAMTGTKCTIKCAPGETQTGGPAVCANGKWVNSPICKDAGCKGKPPLPRNAKSWSCSGTKNGDTCKLACGPGFYSSGDSECSQGKWDVETCIKKKPKPVPKCYSKTIPKPPRGHYPNCVKTQGGMCDIKCPHGYSPTGTRPKCGPNGKWIIAKGRAGRHCKCTPFQRIQGNTPPACIFAGFTGVDRMDFVVDVSGSMRATFTFKSTGKRFSRLGYIQKALYDTLVGLANTQSFNLIKYNPRAYQWKSGVVIASAANKASAKRWIAGLRATGGTNIYAGLQLAMKDRRVQGIFLLTDGSPTVGPRWGSIQALAKRWGSGKGRQIFPIAFKAPSSSWAQMKVMARNTGGKAHHIY
mmetsp:Transcript_145503/g.206067  ORF Transcript_145503/g.206067 Transcript_145503/m.206067 type:complete len:492 (-) Transcript_145503:128-1603(-)